MYRPSATLKRAVLDQLLKGQRARTRARDGGTDGGTRTPVLAAHGEPPVLVQPWEPVPTNGTYRGSLWLWADGTLRNIPEYVVAGSPFDRDWPLEFTPQNTQPA